MLLLELVVDVDDVVGFWLLFVLDRGGIGDVSAVVLEEEEEEEVITGITTA